MSMRIQKHQMFQFSQFNDGVLTVQSQRVGERPPGSSSQPALLLAQSNFFSEDFSQAVKK